MGDILRGVAIGPVAHGGHWVARHEGRVIFVRHALEGETADVRVTGLAKRHAFGDAVSVTEPSPERISPPCVVSADCGGCDFQHVRVPQQRELKRQVVAEQLRRLAGVAWDGEVEAVQPDEWGGGRGCGTTVPTHPRPRGACVAAAHTTLSRCRTTAA